MPAPRNRIGRRLSSDRAGAKTVSARTTRSRQAAVRKWRRDVRPAALENAIAGARSLPWAPRLLEILIEELYVDESVAELLGASASELPKRRYAEAIATALILRHSWQPSDLACIVARLGLKTT
jgi:hypothetical protein